MSMARVCSDRQGYDQRSSEQHVQFGESVRERERERKRARHLCLPSQPNVPPRRLSVDHSSGAEGSTKHMFRQSSPIPWGFVTAFFAWQGHRRCPSSPGRRRTTRSPSPWWTLRRARGRHLGIRCSCASWGPCLGSLSRPDLVVLCPRPLGSAPASSSTDYRPSPCVDRPIFRRNFRPY